VGEFDKFEELLECHLCDTITVIFPDYDQRGTFKIVKTEWNVLEERYESMDLGDLSVSLSEALGVGSSSSVSGGGGPTTVSVAVNSTTTGAAGTNASVTNVGDEVKRGDKILMYEAMKMENNFLAEVDGVIKDIKVKVGDNILQGAVLAIIG
jgi:phage-related protein